MLTPAHLTTLRALAVPGDLWPDVLAADYLGPVSMRWHIDSEEPFEAHGTVVKHFTDIDSPRVLWWSPDERIGMDNRAPVFLRLPLTHRLARAHVAHLLAAGLRCLHKIEEHDRIGCALCKAHPGWIRPPRPAWHLLPPGESATPLPPELAAHAPALLACHVARVAAGGVGVVGVQSAWFEDNLRSGLWWRARIGTGRPCNMLVSASGWELIRPGDNAAVIASGPETGPAGMAAADTAALAAGFALVTANGIALPWPEPATPAADGREKES